MRTKLLLVALWCTSVTLFSTEIKYVTQSGAGTKTGDSWENAYSSWQLQGAINEMSESAGGQIWVAQGTYLPPVEDFFFEYQKYASIELKENVRIYGSFKGDETSIDQRERFDLDENGKIERWEFKYQSIFSGNIGSEKSLTVLTSEKLDSTSFVDGFEIREARAGWSFYDKASVRNCYLKNSVITKNHSVQGSCNGCKLEHCLLHENYSNLNGGGAAHSELSHCIVKNNDAEYSGGAVYYCNVSNSVITNNISHYSCIGLSQLENCLIEKNRSGSIGTISDSELKICVIRDNYCYSELDADPVIGYCKLEKCILGRNKSEAGRDMYDCKINYCIFSDTVNLEKSQIENSFIGHSASGRDSKISHCYVILSVNLYFKQSNLNNCLIANNKKGHFNETTLNNCTVVNNSAVEITDSNDVVVVTNSVLWGNKKLINGTNSYEYSAVQGSLYPGAGNIKLKPENFKGPRFKKPSVSAGIPENPISKIKAINTNWRLSKYSPCVDAGNNEYVKTKTDLDGAKRIRGKSVDMGCYEYRNRFFWWSKNKSMGIQQSDIMEYMLSGPFLLPGETEQPCPFKEAGSDKTQMHEEKPVSGKYNVYPSIFTEEVNIKATSTEKYSIRIFNLSGELKYRKRKSISIWNNKRIKNVQEGNHNKEMKGGIFEQFYQRSDNLTGSETINAGLLPSSVYQLIIETESGKVYPFGIIKE